MRCYFRVIFVWNKIWDIIEMLDIEGFPDIFKKLPNHLNTIGGFCEDGKVLSYFPFCIFSFPYIYFQLLLTLSILFAFSTFPRNQIYHRILGIRLQKTHCTYKVTDARIGLWKQCKSICYRCNKHNSIENSLFTEPCPTKGEFTVAINLIG